MTKKRYRIDVTLLEDLHYGSGLGGSGVDALVSRDRHGLPTIRWPHIKGLLRDALHERQDALAQPPKETAELANALFGDDGSSIKFLTGPRALIRGTSLRHAAVAKDTKVWTSTARELGERVPREDTMRQVEFIRAGEKFTAELQVRAADLPHHGPSKLTTSEWATKLLGRLNRLGGQRTRGGGLVKIELIAVELGPVDAAKRQALQAKKEATVRYRLVLEAQDPVCLPTTGIPGNIISSESHIPARALHGAIVSWCIASGEHVLANLLLAYQIRVAPAYPVPDASADANVAKISDLRAMPMPLGRHGNKPPPQMGNVPWWSGADGQETLHDTLTSRPAQKLKRLGPDHYLYSTDGGNNWHAFSQGLSEHLRNNAGQVRRGGADQALFAVQEIPECTRFVASLTVSASVSKTDLGNALSALLHKEWLLVGRGGTPVKVVGVFKETMHNEVAQSGQLDHGFRIILLSDTIARAKDFSFHKTLSAEALRHLIVAAHRAGGLEMPALDASTIKLQSVSDVAEVHGYNIATRLPRMPALALLRGSEARVTGEKAADWFKALHAIQTDGLGERAFEGYGRFLLTTGPLDVTASSARVPSAAAANELEVSLQKVERMLSDYQPFVIGSMAFSVGRWQALRQCAIDQGERDRWLVAATRCVGNAKSPIDSKTRTGLVIKLGNELGAAQPELIQQFALHAAKRAQRKRAAKPK